MSPAVLPVLRTRTWVRYILVTLDMMRGSPIVIVIGRSAELWYCARCCKRDHMFIAIGVGIGIW